MNKKKKILIFGVTGQDGSFLAKYLISKNYIVHGLVRKSATGNLKNINELIGKNNFFHPFTLRSCKKEKYGKKEK